MKNRRAASLRAVLLAAIAGCRLVAAAESSPLEELPLTEGAKLVAPFELWVATFAPDEGSYPKGPRVLLITNDRSMAIAYVQGRRVELTNTSTTQPKLCDSGRITDHFKAGALSITTDFASDTGEESCWVQGTITVTLGERTATLRVKGVSGI